MKDFSEIQPMDLLPKMVQRSLKKNKQVDSERVTIPDDEDTEIKGTFESTSSNIDILMNKVVKAPKSKKARRAPNAFLLFASEQRKNIPWNKKSSGHVSTVLSHMWKDMSLQEKEKYLMEARRLGELQKIDSAGYLESPSETVKLKKCKSQLKWKPMKKKLEKKTLVPRSKKVLRSFSFTSESIKSKMVLAKKEETVSVAKQSVMAAAESVGGPEGESKPTIDYSFHDCNSSNSLPPVTSSPNAPELSCRCHFSYRRPIDRRADVCAQSPMFSTGMHMPYLGAGLSQSLLPQSPLADFSLWMYRQSLFQYAYNFPPPAFLNPYNSFSYPPHSPYSSLYSNSYMVDHCRGHLNSTAQPCSAAAANITSATATSMNNTPSTSITHATTTTMTSTTSMTHDDSEEQEDRVDLDSNTLLIMDDEEPKVPVVHE